MSTCAFLVYNDTGRILRAGICRDVDVEAQAVDPGDIAMQTAERVEPTEFYILDGVVTPRPPTTIVASVEGRTITLTGIPVGSTVVISGGDSRTYLTADDPSGSMEIEVPVAGNYFVRVDTFPELPFSATVTVA